MRAVLAILIAVTQTAGPWVCCCGPERLARVFDSGRPAEPAPVAPGASCQSVCPLCAKTPSPSPAPEPVRGPHTPPPAQPCPCGGVELVAVPVSKADGQDWVASGLVTTAMLPAEAVVVVSLTPDAVAGLRQLPLLTTADRLYAHHALRC